MTITEGFKLTEGPEITGDMRRRTADIIEERVPGEIREYDAANLVLHTVEIFGEIYFAWEIDGFCAVTRAGNVELAFHAFKEAFRICLGEEAATKRMPAGTEMPSRVTLDMIQEVAEALGPELFRKRKGADISTHNYGNYQSLVPCYGLRSMRAPHNGYEGPKTWDNAWMQFISALKTYMQKKEGGGVEGEQAVAGVKTRFLARIRRMWRS